MADANGAPSAPVPSIPLEQQENEPLLILMYHNFTNDPAQVTEFTVTAQRLEQDIVMLQEHGYTFLLPQDWLDIIAGKQERPKKPVMLTFDDGYLSNYTLAYPILQKYNAKAVISVVASLIGQMENKITWEQAREMYQSGLVEIQSHTYNLHNPYSGGMISPDYPTGILPYPNESQGEYTTRALQDLAESKRLIEQEVGNSVFFLCFPFGERTDWVDPILEQCGFTMTCVTSRGVGNADNQQFNLVRYNVNMQTSLAKLVKQNKGG